MFWEFEDGLTNTITGATESAGRSCSAAEDTALRPLAAVIAHAVADLYWNSPFSPIRWTSTDLGNLGT